MGSNLVRSAEAEAMVRATRPGLEMQAEVWQRARVLRLEAPRVKRKQPRNMQRL